jgi:hypothetical protein
VREKGREEGEGWDLNTAIKANLANFVKGRQKRRL